MARIERLSAASELKAVRLHSLVMREYLIQCIGNDWSLPYKKWSKVFRPNSIAFKYLLGTEYRIEVLGVTIYFADESPGIQVCVEGELPEELTRQIVGEVLNNLQQLAGQKGEVIEI